jgi:hypothetical protein
MSSKCAILVERGCDPKYAAVALQLSNNDLDHAHELVQRMQERRAQLVAAAPQPATQDSEGLHFVTADTAESSASPVKGPFSPAGAGHGAAAAEEEPMSDWNSEDSNWEVVDFKCPKCGSDDPSQADQVIPCSICTQQYHTHCAGVRRIPFSNKTPEESENRDRYVRKHFANWKCEKCIACAADLDGSESGGQKIGSRSSLSSLGSEGASRTHSRTNSRSQEDGSTIATSIAGIASRHAHAGGVIITDGVRSAGIASTAGNATPSGGSVGSGKANLNASTTKSGKTSLLFPNRNSTEASPPSSKASSPSKPTLESSHLQTPGPHGAHLLMSPSTRSKAERDAALLGLLASHGLTAEGVAALPEAEQKETMLRVLNANNGANSLNSSSMSTSGSGSGKEGKHDLATALKGLVAKAAGDNVRRNTTATSATPAPTQPSAAAEGETAPLDARAAMLEVIRRKAAMAQGGDGGGVAGATKTEAPDISTMSVSARAAAMAAASGNAVTAAAQTATPGPAINSSGFAKYFSMVKVGEFVCWLICLHSPMTLLL